MLANATQPPILVDRVAAMLDSIADCSTRGEAPSVALEAADGAAPKRMVAELQLLRRTIHEVNARAPRPASFDELRVLDDAIDAAVVATVSRAGRELEELRFSEARLRTMFDHSPAAMFIKDADGRFVMLNRTCAVLLGGSPESIVGRLEHDIVAREIADAHLANDRVVLERRQPIEIEEWLPYQGELRTFLSIKFAAVGPNEQPLVCGIATDITVRKRIEDGQRFLVEAGRILGASLDYEATFARVAQLATPVLADACTVDVVEAGKLRRLVFVGDPTRADAVHEFVAGTPPSLDSKRLVAVAIRSGSSFLFPILEDETLDRFETPEYVRRSLRALQIQSVMVVPLLGRTEALGALAFAASHRRYGPLDLSLAEGLARVVADAIENARLYGEAREAMHHREDVLAIVSHDLRSPLAAVRLASHVLARCAQGDVCAKQLEVVQRATQRMERLISDLLQATAIRARHLIVTQKPEDLRLLLEAALDGHAELAKRSEIQLERAFGSEPIEVSCDRDRIEQVLSNLLGNALKFCHAGDTVTLGVESSEHEVRVLVSDTGPGIDEGDLARLFDPYWSARAHEGKGTGLGLFISKGLVEAHGGRVGVVSRRGPGTTFWFTLPRMGAPA